VVAAVGAHPAKVKLFLAEDDDEPIATAEKKIYLVKTPTLKVAVTHEEVDEGKPIDLEVTAADNSALSSFLDGADLHVEWDTGNKGTIEPTPDRNRGKAVWNTTGVNSGTYTVTAKLVDKNGRALESAAGPLTAIGAAKIKSKNQPGTRILWTQKQDVGPGERNSHAMAYDSIRGFTVLFGGADPDGNLFGDTWEWDGENWTQMQDVGPSPRFYSAMAFDAERKQTLLFGGELNQLPTPVFADTWAWDGQAWTQLADSGPAGRAGHTLAYDSHRQRTVLFGGMTVGGVSVTDTWE
jgi:hypothetical protein